jgi:1-acyl-sn-glycerol-3-phosphate acyltransferase
MTAPSPTTVTRQPAPGPRRLLGIPARLILRLMGWRIVNRPPALARYVVIGAPHTANLDGFLMILVAMTLQLRLNFLMKDSWFKGVLGPISRGLGGIAIDRSQRHDTVEQIVAAFNARDSLALAIAPEGTRRRTDHWHSGFYHIALQAGVPLVLAYADYPRKEIGFSPALHLSGDIRADMDIIRAFYAGKTGQHPEKASPIRLRAEDAPPDSDQIPDPGA